MIITRGRGDKGAVAIGPAHPVVLPALLKAIILNDHVVPGLHHVMVRIENLLNLRVEIVSRIASVTSLEKGLGERKGRLDSQRKSCRNLRNVNSHGSHPH